MRNAALACALALAGCYFPPLDLSGRRDAGAGDAGARDGGFDAAREGGIDAGIDASTDGGANDAGDSDSGASDAGPEDGGPPPCGTLFHESSYQDGVIPSILFLNRIGAHSLTVVPAPWDGSRDSLRVLIRSEEEYMGPSPLAEVSWGFPDDLFELGTLYRADGAFWFDEGTFEADGGVIGGPLRAIFQIQPTGGALREPLVLQIRDGVLEALVGWFDGSGPTTRVIGPVPTGRRVPFQVVYRPSTGSDGRIQVTVDGLAPVTLDGPNASAGTTSGGYHKQGLAGAINVPEVSLHLDDLRICID